MKITFSRNVYLYYEITGKTVRLPRNSLHVQEVLGHVDESAFYNS